MRQTSLLELTFLTGRLSNHQLDQQSGSSSNSLEDRENSNRTDTRPRSTRFHVSRLLLISSLSGRWFLARISQHSGYHATFGNYNIGCERSSLWRDSYLRRNRSHPGAGDAENVIAIVPEEFGISGRAVTAIVYNLLRNTVTSSLDSPIKL